MLPEIAALHPFIVHFAVAFTLASALLDGVDLSMRRAHFERTSFHLAVIALPFLIAAVLTGNLASQFITETRARQALDAHETFANIAVWLFCAAAVWRIFLQLKKEFFGGRKLAYTLAILLAATAVFLAARQGGTIRHRPYPPTATHVAAGPSPHPAYAPGSIRPLRGDVFGLASQPQAS
jgi:uncharacterized membrane protein